MAKIDSAWITAGVVSRDGGPGGWLKAGACHTSDPRARAVDPDTFYPGSGSASDPAKRVCRDCPVAQWCLLFALVTREQHGVWGGASRRERKVLGRPDPAVVAGVRPGRDGIPVRVA